MKFRTTKHVQVAVNYDLQSNYYVTPIVKAPLSTIRNYGSSYWISRAGQIIGKVQMYFIISSFNNDDTNDGNVNN